MRRQKIPQTDSIQELARFWDSHDLTEFEDLLQEVRRPVFERPGGAVVRVRLNPEELALVKRIARAKGIGHVLLVRKWLRERLRREAKDKAG